MTANGNPGENQNPFFVLPRFAAPIQAPVQALSRDLPLALRAFIMARPLRVRIRARKP